MYIVRGDLSYFFNLPLEAKVIGLSFVIALTAILSFSITKSDTSLTPNTISLKKLNRVFLIFFEHLAEAVRFGTSEILFSTGGIMWSTSFRDLNYKWALNFLNFTSSSTPDGNIFLFVLLLVLIPFTVFVGGTHWLSTKIFGLIDYVRHKNLIFIVWITSHWLSYFWWTIYHFRNL